MLTVFSALFSHFYYNYKFNLEVLYFILSESGLREFEQKLEMSKNKNLNAELD